MIKKILVIIILLSAVSLAFTLPQPFQFICGLLQAFFLPGLVFMFFMFDGRFSRSDQIFFSILISPILLILLIIPVNIVTGGIYLSAKIILIACYLLFIIAFILGKGSHTKENGRSVPSLIFIVSFFYGGLILASYLINNFLLIRSDSWYHASVISEIISRGIPPKEPFLADFSIKYMWIYHLFQTVWIKLSGLSLFKAMGFSNIINAFIFPYLIARFTSYFTDKKYLIIFVSLFALAGLESVSWVLWPACLVRVLTGDVTGMAEIHRIIANITINGPSVIAFLRPWGTWQVSLSDKFLTITVFNYSLNLFLASLIIVLNEKLLKNSRVKSSLLLFILILGTFLFHVVTGGVLLFTIIGSAILMYIGSRYIYREDRPLSDYSVFLIPAVLASFVALIYFLSITTVGNSQGGDSLANSLFHFGIKNILTILFPLIILFFPARTAFKKLLSGRDYQSRMLVSWIICLILLNIVINIDIVGEKKLVYFLFLIIGPIIYIQIVEKTRVYQGVKRILLIAALIILFLIPPVLTFRGFIIAVPETSVNVRRNQITNEDKSFYGWIKDNTPDDSVIIENNIYHLSPVFAGRRNLYSWTGVAKVLDYGGEKKELYRDIQNSLYGKEEISVEVIGNMKKVKQRLYVAVWKEDIQSCPWLVNKFSSKSRWFKEVYSSDRVSLYTLREQRS